jgi:hypothetical protein
MNRKIGDKTFSQKVSGNLCMQCEHKYPDCDNEDADRGNGLGENNVIGCKGFKEKNPKKIIALCELKKGPFSCENKYGINGLDVCHCYKGQCDYKKQYEIKKTEG